MSTGTGRQQGRLLPYLLVVLVVLLAYLVYTRLLRPAPPAAVVAPPTPVAVSPAATPSPSPGASPPAAPAPTPSPSPGAEPVPPRPSGRSNPFAALVVERPPAAPTAPSPPPVPPPFFPGRPGEAGGTGTKLAGVLMKDGEALAIVQVGQVTYIVSEGDVIEQFRVARIEPERVVLRSGTRELSLELGGEQK